MTPQHPATFQPGFATTDRPSDRSEPAGPTRIESFRHLPVLQLQFRLVAEDDFVGYPIIGSTLRGAFGRGLKLAACTVAHGECARCILNSACHYTNIFEPQFERNAPRPFTFQIPVPPLNPKLSIEDSLRFRIASGASMSFGMTLFGSDVLKRLPYLVLGVKHLACRGLGMPRKRFTLSDVSAGGPQVRPATHADSLPILSRATSLFDLCERRVESVSVRDRLTIRILTPIWLRQEGKLMEKPSFFHLIKFILTRLRNIFAFYGEGPLNIDEPTYLDAAREVETLNETIWRHDFDFYSNRRHRKESHSGTLGEMIFVSERLGMFLPLLVAGELVHIGTKTSFGLGRYEIR